MITDMIKGKSFREELKEFLMEKINQLKVDYDEAKKFLKLMGFVDQEDLVVESTKVKKKKRTYTRRSLDSTSIKSAISTVNTSRSGMQRGVLAAVARQIVMDKGKATPSMIVDNIISSNPGRSFNRTTLLDAVRSYLSKDPKIKRMKERDMAGKHGQHFYSIKYRRSTKTNEKK